VAVIAGMVNIPEDDYHRAGIEAAISCKTDEMSLDYALKSSRELLRSAAKHFTEQYLCR
jgi:glycerate kinase